MATIRQTRRDAYKAARRLGDVEAAMRGPAAYGKRVVRRKVYRTSNRTLGRTLRGFGL